MTHPYTDAQLDAFRELSNVASGTAATALSQLLGREVELSLPLVRARPLTDAIRGSAADDSHSGVAIPVEGDVDAVVLMVMPAGHGEILCRMLGVEPESELADSALREIGNILGASYLGAMASMTGLSLLPSLPQLSRAGLDTIVGDALVDRPGATDDVLTLDSELRVAGEACALSFLLVPSTHGASELLAPIGLAEPTVP